MTPAAGPRRAPALAAHLAAVGAFGGLAILQSWPLAAHLSTSLPGPPGDNFAFLWNFWWMREALATGAPVFHTPDLFAPTGVDLTLNTHTALPAFIGATLFARLPVVAAQNLFTIVSLALNGIAAYAAACRVTTDRGAAFFGGVVFAFSAYLSAHLLGHFNLTSAFVLPLFAIACLPAVEGSRRAAALAGVVLAATAFIDDYYLVYELAMTVAFVLVVDLDWTWSRRADAPAWRRLSRIAAATAVLLAIVVAAIAATGGWTIRVAGHVVSMRDVYNPLQAFWGVAALWLVARLRPSLRLRWRLGPTWRAVARAGAVMAGVFLAGAAPLVWRGIRLAASGGYVAPRFFWRSAPAGIDLATLVLGNPLHPWWGPGVLRVYERLGLSQTESLAWLGVAATLLAATAVRRLWTDAVVRRWLIVGAIFFVWAMGPHLRAAGVDTAILLPQTLLHYVPIVSNARMPARAMAVVSLAVAMLAAAGAAWVRARSRRPGVILAGLLAAVLVDQSPAPFPLVALDRPRLYDTLGDRPEPGALCELPTGLADGFGEEGGLDRRTLYYQTIHHRPIVGGFVGRLPASVRAAYAADPVLSALIDLSSASSSAAATPPDGADAVAGLRRDGIAFVMLNRATAPPALVRYVEQVLPLTPVATEGARTLYVVPPAPAAPGGR